MSPSRGTLPVKTDKGVFGLEFSDRGLCRLYFPGQGPVLERVKREAVPDQVQSWGRMISGQLVDYLKGSPVPFSGFPLDESMASPFERKVLKALRRVRRGRTLSYGDLACKAGVPGAARAVGTVMSRNRLPIIYPCHRILPRSGGIGRYGPGEGWKRTLLSLETRG